MTTLGKIHQLILEDFFVGEDDDQPVVGADHGIPEIDGLHHTEGVVGLDQITDHEGASEGEVDPGDEIGREVLEGEGQGHTHNTRTGEERGDGLVEFEDPEGDDDADGDDRNATEGREQTSHGLAVGHLGQETLDQLAGHLRKHHENHEDGEGHHEVGQEGHTRFEPPTQLVADESEGFLETRDGFAQHVFVHRYLLGVSQKMLGQLLRSARHMPMRYAHPRRKRIESHKPIVS